MSYTTISYKCILIKEINLNIYINYNLNMKLY